MTARLPRRPFLYPITDRGLGQEPHPALVQALFQAGAAVVQLRAKNLGDDELLDAAVAASRIAKRMGRLLIINDRADVAVLADAAGVHLGSDDLDPRAARRIVGSHRLVGVSTHSVSEALRAGGEDVDYVALGPIFASTTKTGRGALGTEAIRRVKEQIPVPLVAIGGIDMARFPEVVAAGADGIAVVSAAMRPGRVAPSTRELLQRLRGEAGA